MIKYARRQKAKAAKEIVIEHIEDAPSLFVLYIASAILALVLICIVSFGIYFD